MKILLVNPSCIREEGRDLYTSDLLGPLFTLQPKKRMALGIPLALPTLAAHTPARHTVQIRDEEIETIDFGEPADLVGITAMTFKARRAYEIAREFRKRNVKVVMGGIHASMCPDEALEHVDGVVVGEAEDVWPSLLSDAEKGRLKKKYTADGFPDLARSRTPRYDLVQNRNYLYTYLQTTRGCPYDCSFCTVTKQNGNKIRRKRAEQVICELDTLIRSKPKKQLDLIDRRDGKRKRFVGTIAFIDDNFAIDRNHALEICEALRKYQEERGIVIAWYTQVNISTGLDEELLSAMAASNCLHLFIGVESLDPSTLRQMKKKMNRPERYEEAIRNIHRHGIRVIASTIIGDDRTSWAGARRLKSFVQENDLFHVLLNILTPYPGTVLLDQMIREDRILTFDPQKYNIRNVVFRPKNLSPEELQEIYVWLCTSIFGYDEMYRRGLKLLDSQKNFMLPLPSRLAGLLGFSIFSMFYMLRGRIGLKPGIKALLSAPHLFLVKGAFFVMELLCISIDYHHFAASEKKRFAPRKPEKDNHAAMAGLIEKSLLEFPLAGRNGKPQKNFRACYINAARLREKGIHVPEAEAGRPLLLLGGTSIPLAHRMELMEFVLRSGREVAAIENPTGGLFDWGMNPKRERAESLRDYLDHLILSEGVKELDIVAQSYSAFEVVRVIRKNPEGYAKFVRRILFINPPGLDEHIRFFRHCFRFTWNHVLLGALNSVRDRKRFQGGHTKREVAGILKWTAQTLKNPVRTFKEVSDIVDYRIKDPIRELTRLYGYDIRFFVQMGDRLIPPDVTVCRLKEIVSDTKIRCVEGGHNDLIFQKWQRKAFLDFLSLDFNGA